MLFDIVFFLYVKKARMTFRRSGGYEVNVKWSQKIVPSDGCESDGFPDISHCVRVLFLKLVLIGEMVSNMIRRQTQGSSVSCWEDQMLSPYKEASYGCAAVIGSSRISEPELGSSGAQNNIVVK